MKYAFMNDLNDIRMGEAPAPSPAPGFVQVKIQSCGICGSDVHYYKDGTCGEYKAFSGFILGHEVSGIVTELGKDVTNLKVGDRVALEPGYACGKCEFCKSGKYNLCPNVIFFATPPVQGALCEYVCHPADMCFILPDTVSFDEGALVEPLCVGMHASRLSGITLGDSAIILGSGCIGLMTLMAIRASGAANTIVVDRFQSRLEHAKRLGATHVINAADEDVDKRIEELLSSVGADFVFECAGAVATAQKTPYYVKRGGTIMLVGSAPEAEFSFNFGRCLNKEITIKSIFRYRNLYPAAISAIENNLLDVNSIVSHRFDFADTQKAFRTVVDHSSDVVKAVIRF